MPQSDHRCALQTDLYCNLTDQSRPGCDSSTSQPCRVPLVRVGCFTRVSVIRYPVAAESWEYPSCLAPLVLHFFRVGFLARD